MEVRAAHHGERDEVLDLLARWYNDREFFARYNHNDPAFRDALCLVARDRGQLVSTVQIFDRAINLDGQSVPMGGIGSVFTLEEYRHKGVASARMRLACRSSARTGDHRRATLLRSASAPAAPAVLVTHTAHDPALERALEGAGCPVAHHTDNFYMWRVLAPDKLARRFAVDPEAASARAFEIFADSRSFSGPPTVLTKKSSRGSSALAAPRRYPAPGSDSL